MDAGALVVEWGERLPARWRDEALHVAIEVTGPSSRELTACATRGRGLALLAAWRSLVPERTS